MALVIDIVSWALIAGGVFFAVTGGIGLLRFPDFFTRMHAASVTDTGGAILLFTGLMLQAGSWLVAVKLFLILALLLFTGPTATHALSRAALHDGLEPRLDRREDG